MDTPNNKYIMLYNALTKDQYWLVETSSSTAKKSFGKQKDNTTFINYVQTHISTVKCG